MNPRIRIFVTLLSGLAATVASAGDYPPPTEGDYTIPGFKFQSGETLPELRVHYRTLGKPEKDAQGKTTNAVLITHGTTGSGAQFIRPEFAGELFGKDQRICFRYEIKEGPKIFETEIRGKKFAMYNDTIIGYAKDGTKIIETTVEEPVHIRPEKHANSI